MPEEVKNAAEEQDKTTIPAESETKEVPEVKEEATIGNVLGKKEEKQAKLVPEAVLIEYKKENKELVKEIKELKKMVEDGATKKEVSATVSQLAAEYPESKEFIEKFYTAIRAEAEANIESKVSSKLKGFEEKENATRIEKIFNEHFEKTLEVMPEYKSLVNKEVIKSLSLDPKNANKTFPKILEEAYGHLVTGKKTLETTVPRGGKDTAIDFNRAKNNQEYFKEIMADPELKRQYNDDLAKRLRL